jgi:Fe2+ transport system protein FeoA
LQPSLNYHTLGAVKQKMQSSLVILEGRCAGPEVCPLSRVQAGAEVCIKQLTTAPDMTQRLRELGFCEEQRIKLVARESSFICQVCNARLGISQKLADSILVEKVPARRD